MLPQKLTPADVEAEIADTRYLVDGTMTIAVVECHNGFKAVGWSNCVNPNDYDKGKGEAAARGRALEQIYIALAFERHATHARVKDRSRYLGAPGFAWATPSEAL